MGRNILIFSDGTGQAGGLMPDEDRSNIYKLYRATRCGPDSTIDPSKQLAFYDPGLGSQTDNGRIKFGWARWLRNLVSQGTGLGITANIIDCYSAIIRLWQPGDRIYLFGFSRGAYTIRCLGGVLALCGVPTQMKDGTKLRRDPKSARTIAKEAVKEVYQLGASIKGDPFKELRQERARKFRTEFKSDDGGYSNVYPYFIGVFDTVAALGASLPARIAFGVVAIVLASLVAAGAGWIASYYSGSFVFWFAVIVGTALILMLAIYAKTHIRYHPKNKRLYHAAWSMKFYDYFLNRRVGFARHACSIDELRADFERVRWDYDGDARARTDNEPDLLRQVWFPGNHSDIGGSYPENESRLSDISLSWMVEQLNELPHSVDINESVLHLFPAADGPQHDECKKGFPGIWGSLGIKWKAKCREVAPDAPLHSSVTARFEKEFVLQYDESAPYRPESLRGHKDVAKYYLK